MRTLAFYFAAEDAARAVAAELRGDQHLGHSTLETAPLVVDRVEGTVLAVSVDEEAAATIVELAIHHGGRLVADVAQDRRGPA